MSANNKDWLMLCGFFESKVKENDYRMFALDKYEGQQMQALAGMMLQTMTTNVDFAKIVMSVAEQYGKAVMKASEEQMARRKQVNIDITPFIGTSKSFS